MRRRFLCVCFYCICISFRIVHSQELSDHANGDVDSKSIKKNESEHTFTLQLTGLNGENISQLMDFGNGVEALRIEIPPRRESDDVTVLCFITNLEQAQIRTSLTIPLLRQKYPVKERRDDEEWKGCAWSEDTACQVSPAAALHCAPAKHRVYMRRADLSRWTTRKHLLSWSSRGRERGKSKRKRKRTKIKAHGRRNGEPEKRENLQAGARDPTLGGNGDSGWSGWGENGGFGGPGWEENGDIGGLRRGEKGGGRNGGDGKGAYVRKSGKGGKRSNVRKGGKAGKRSKGRKGGTTLHLLRETHYERPHHRGKERKECKKCKEKKGGKKEKGGGEDGDRGKGGKEEKDGDDCLPKCSSVCAPNQPCKCKTKICVDFACARRRGRDGSDSDSQTTNKNSESTHATRTNSKSLHTTENNFPSTKDNSSCDSDETNAKSKSPPENYKRPNPVTTTLGSINNSWIPSTEDSLLLVCKEDRSTYCRKIKLANKKIEESCADYVSGVKHCTENNKKDAIGYICGTKMCTDCIEHDCLTYLCHILYCKTKPVEKHPTRRVSGLDTCTRCYKYEYNVQSKIDCVPCGSYSQVPVALVPKPIFAYPTG